MRNKCIAGLVILLTGLPVLTNASPPTIGINSGGCTFYTIQDALNASSSDDTIQVSAGTYHENVTISGKTLTLIGGYDATCTSPEGGSTIVDGGGIDSVFVIEDDSTVILRNLDITGGSATLGGGVRIVSGNSEVRLDNTDIFGNQASYGGGIYVDVGDTLLSINDSDIRNNNATTSGGGGRIWGTFIAYGVSSDIYENSAPHGGALSLSTGTVILNNAKVYQNTATAFDGKGGGIYVRNEGTIMLMNTAAIYYENRAYNGAGIYANNATVTMQGTATLSDNIASNNGGAVYLTNNSTLTLNGGGRIGQEGVIEIANEALRGAGVYAIDSTVNCSGGIVVNNIAALGGGGVYADNSTVNVSGNAAVYNNTATTGGAFYLNGSTLEALNVTFRDNQATGDGGAIAAYDSSLTFDADFALCDPSSTQCMSFYNNEADTDEINYNHGGAIYYNDCSLSMDHTYLHHNSAYRGGAIYQEGSGISVGHVYNSLFYNNTVMGSTGSAIRVLGGDLFLTHVTLADNIGAPGVSCAGGGNIVVFNTIVWGNPSGGFQGPITDSGCNIDQSGNAGIVSDPLFVSPGPGEDYHLQRNSPAINACVSGLAIDLDNRPRRLYDMGAFGYHTFPWLLFLPSMIGNSP